MDLLNKTIVITGASAGIGAETARLARMRGATVIGIDRNAPSLTLDGFIQADLGQTASIDAAVAQLPARVDALCNVAGVPGTADGDLVARVNYLGLRHLTERVLERMPAGGSIVNIASILGAEWPQRVALHKELAAAQGFEAGAAWLRDHPVPHETCYQYFKEALLVWSYVQSQAWFLEKSVRMNCVAPGPVFTAILGDFVSMLGEERVQRDSARMKRPAYPDEVAPVAVFLCSDAARWISGVNIPVDGGLASTFI
ncbi:coniferyl-alcohol dehydrogenase [Pseudoduganella namucuonensis]|uniref:NAD(P)-dependent dehydrogenase, short-chain alcohol dehydrogenase family n=1 Tax=Pseudoduganella namucuonensis TaxID=1035707 RepID=A0A1I7L7H9_9BURK|nr:coniferyl-alcohol dehydrogenase [Pseudoduganella namucuonensis]SFV05588.1 NAD(P)-dependent dehydrogenase, short-chain alcohol dehydrogenase family [Pseudoduganella namucuonensis]